MDHDLTSTAPDGAGSPVDVDTATPPSIRLSSPGSVVASIPVMFGFHPEDSLIVLGLSATTGGQRDRLRHGVRIALDQIRGQERMVASELAARLHEQGADHALLIAFGPRTGGGLKARPDHCRKLMAAFRAQLGAGPRDERITVVDAIYTTGSRWWSYMCRNPRCCPASGTMVPAQPPTALVAALAYQGVAVFASREALDETLAPYNVGGPAVRKMTTALTSAERVHATKDVRRRIAASRIFADRLLTRSEAGAAPLTDKEVATMLAGLNDWEVRDHLACAAAEADGAERLLILSVELARRGPDDAHRMAPYALAAWAAWALGRNSLAQCAVDRALAVDPTYNFAALIRAGLHHGISADSVRMSARSTRRELEGEEAALGDLAAPVASGQSELAGLPAQRRRRGGHRAIARAVADPDFDIRDAEEA